MTTREFDALVLFLQQTPERVRVLTTGVPAQDLCVKNFPAEFSVLEHVCHLRDIEAEGYGPRLRRILSEDKPLLPDVDGVRLAIERDYNGQNLASALQAFSQARASYVEVLRSVSENQLTREGDLEGVGTITLWQLLELQREHDDEHLRQLSVLRQHLGSARLDTA